MKIFLRHQSAFTLIEMLITLTLISILSAMTISGLHEMFQRAQDESVREDLLRLLALARDEAELRQKTMVISKDNEWSRGQFVFVDTARDGVLHDRSQIIAVNKMPLFHGELHTRFYPRYRDSIQFYPLIFQHNDNGTMWYCRQYAASPVWAIQINRVGTAHVLLPDANGEIKDSHGTVFQC